MAHYRTKNRQKGQARSRTRQQNFWQNGMPPHIPDGEYQVVYSAYDEVSLFKGRRRFLYFRVMEPGDYLGQSLFMACQMPKNGKWGISSKYLRMWLLATGQRPKRRDRLSPSAFEHKIFKAKVRSVKKDSQQQPLSQAAQYSVIDCLIAKLQ